MVIVQLIGGLGNQLFQYCAGRALAVKHGTSSRVDASAFLGDTLRCYALRHFQIKADILTDAERNSLGLVRTAGSGIRAALYKLFRRGSQIRLITERGFGFDPGLLDAPPTCYLRGYWQSPKYFQAIEPLIRRELTVSSPLLGQNAAVADQIRSTLAVSVHVRRGDYVTNAHTNQYHGICSPEYYYAAEKLLRNRVGDLQLFVFSDDPQWAQENLRFLSPTVVVSHNPPEHGHEDLRLMAMCRHHIIANSTFSWWGAWLCDYTDKVVIAPQKWFCDAGHSTEDLIPKTWIKV